MPDRIRAVLDTNVILSAILFGGTPLQALDAWRLQGLFNLVISPEILAEVLGKLEAKFNFPPYLIQEWQWLLSRNVIRALPVQRIEACRDPSDNKFLETSVAASARFLVTGDRDLLDLGAYEDIRIVTPREFLDHLGLSLAQEPIRKSGIQAADHSSAKGRVVTFGASGRRTSPG